MVCQQGAVGVGGGHDVTVDVGKAKHTFVGRHGLVWTNGEQHVTRQLNVLFYHRIAAVEQQIRCVASLGVGVFGDGGCAVDDTAC